MLFFAVTTFLVCIIILWRIDTMNDKLRAAIDGLTAEVADSNGKLNSIRTFVQGVPALVAAAVETALANANVDEETAATEIAAATDAVSQNVDATLDAIDQNPAGGDEALPPVSEAPAEAEAGAGDAGGDVGDEAAAGGDAGEGTAPTE
jgi:hypothetical protein